jgi:hypothetical protein
MPLALNDDELAALMDCARPLATPQDRSQFLATVAARLAKYELLGAGLVARVAREAQREYFAAPSLRNVGWVRHPKI